MSVEVRVAVPACELPSSNMTWSPPTAALPSELMTFKLTRTVGVVSFVVAVAAIDVGASGAMVSRN